ncbi:efflux RND transporter periplasmic adaptor subunit [Phormidium sp. CLA17]|uniref:efflux RND transporter periplasmic adaptor subunit n=1 Tax=Leptolyngbya sp. Cla-17 TaxID=2803751 RepID=UPI0014931300|nr:efflux RND transporter periplasmic adaptor subunit [Leptolyngbya sp. Cla-17]MBM0740165.1 efflux RND transporter periplasmic adaptor subunit [Leptolyngbya sp. Cla-17]
MSGLPSSKSKYSEPVEAREHEIPPAKRKPRSPLGSKSSTNRWLAIGGLLLVLLGLAFGWRWWQASQAAARGTGAEMPSGIPVKLGTTQTATVQESSEYVGSLESLQSVILKPEITGRISGILVKSGDSVQAGDPLIQLKPDKREAEVASGLAAVNSARAIRSNAVSQLQETQADRIAKQAEVDLQNQEYRRISSLVKEGALSRQLLDRTARDRTRAISELRAMDQRIQSAKASIAESESGLQQAQANANLNTAQLQDTTITAPFSGIVGDVPVRLGQIVEVRDTLTTVTQNESLDLKLSIPLERAAELRIGLPVELTNAQGKILSRGRVSFISPQSDSRSQSVLAKATFANSSGKLRDGQFARARVVWRSLPGILIPSSAISRLGGENFVFVAQAPNDTCKEILKSGPPGAPAGEPSALVARQRLIKLGSIQGNSYHVLEGLKPNERVVVSGILNLSECSAIAEATGNGK